MPPSDEAPQRNASKETVANKGDSRGLASEGSMEEKGGGDVTGGGQGGAGPGTRAAREDQNMEKRTEGGLMGLLGSLFGSREGEKEKGTEREKGRGWEREVEREMMEREEREWRRREKVEREERERRKRTGAQVKAVQSDGTALDVNRRDQEANQKDRGEQEEKREKEENEKGEKEEEEKREREEKEKREREEKEKEKAKERASGSRSQPTTKESEDGADQTEARFIDVAFVAICALVSSPDHLP